jgi:hypothetical protein
LFTLSKQVANHFTLRLRVSAVKSFHKFSARIFPAIHLASIQSIPGQAGGGTMSIAAWQIAASSTGGAADKTVRLFSDAPAGA